MKHIKKSKPQINDYVICNENSFDKPLQEFLSNNIGQIIYKDNNGDFYVQYNNIPHNIRLNFRILFDQKQSNVRFMLAKEIIFFSPNISDCETFLASNKYNL